VADILTKEAVVAEQIARMIGDDPSGPNGGAEPPSWLDDVSIQVDASPTVVNLGQSTVVTWSVGLPTGGPTLQVRLNGEPVAKSGSRSVVLPRKRTFTVLVSGTRLGVHAQTSKSVTVEVTYPCRVVIDPSTPDPVQVLIGALDSANPQQTVEMCGVDLDLTGFTGIVIRDGRSLVASPGCERGPRRCGPRIFVTDERGHAALFEIQGDHVRFSGFRLEGPTTGIGKGELKEVGILISPACNAENPRTLEPIRSIEISNMEIFHWSGVGVEVSDNVGVLDNGGVLLERGRLFNTNPGAVCIRGCYFHHNQHGAGEGYGVAVTHGGYATIEQCVFDENRHAIAGGSKNDHALDYSGYTVRDNLILEGGGIHCADSAAMGGLFGGIAGGFIGGVIGGLVGGPYGAVFGAAIGVGAGVVIGVQGGSICWQTHQIDMHGDKNAWYSSNNWQCGTAGETMIIERNTILYTGGHTTFFKHGLAIKIRGDPADKAVVDGNVFKHKSGEAIAQSGACSDDVFPMSLVTAIAVSATRPIDVRPNNQYGKDPMIELGSGDFVGDGQPDAFMATGVTWWAKSSVTDQWRYLNTMSERLPQLLLQRVDDGPEFDVGLRPRKPGMPLKMYSKSGTGPWVRIGGAIEA
jgi:hypothetical protein